MVATRSEMAAMSFSSTPPSARPSARITDCTSERSSCIVLEVLSTGGWYPARRGLDGSLPIVAVMATTRARRSSAEVEQQVAAAGRLGRAGRLALSIGPEAAGEVGHPHAVGAATVLVVERADPGQQWIPVGRLHHRDVRPGRHVAEQPLLVDDLPEPERLLLDRAERAQLGWLEGVVAHVVVVTQLAE